MIDSFTNHSNSAFHNRLPVLLTGGFFLLPSYAERKATKIVITFIQDDHTNLFCGAFMWSLYICIMKPLQRCTLTTAWQWVLHATIILMTWQATYMYGATWMQTKVLSKRFVSPKYGLFALWQKYLDIKFCSYQHRSAFVYSSMICVWFVSTQSTWFIHNCILVPYVAILLFMLPISWILAPD